MAFAMVRGSVMFMMLVPPSKAPHGALIRISSRSGWVWSAIAVGRNENGRKSFTLESAGSVTTISPKASKKP